MALHVDSGWNSNVATTNIFNLVKALNVDLYTEVIEWDEMKDLQNSFLNASVINCDIPQDHAFKAIQYKIANKLNIYDFISGRNQKVDSMMPYGYVGHPNEDGKHLKDIQKKFGNKKLIKYPIFNIYYGRIYMKYFKGYNDIKILENVEYKRSIVEKFLVKEFNFINYYDKHYESIFTQFFQGYYLIKKFGIDKRKANLSGLIKNREISRKKALNELKKPLIATNEIEPLLNYIAKKLGINKKKINILIKKKQKDHFSFDGDYKFIYLFKKMIKNFFNNYVQIDEK